MKKLLWLAFLLPFFAQAQVNGTIQKTVATDVIRGTFGSSGIDTIPTIRTISLANGDLLQYNSTTKKWTNVTTSSIGYVPYTGATSDVDLGAHSITANALKLTNGAGTATITGAASNQTIAFPALSGTVPIFASTPVSGGIVGWSGTSGAQTNITALPNGTTATTQSAADNSTKVATTAYVDSAIPTSADYWTTNTTQTGLTGNKTTGGSIRSQSGGSFSEFSSSGIATSDGSNSSALYPSMLQFNNGTYDLSLSPQAFTADRTIKFQNKSYTVADSADVPTISFGAFGSTPNANGGSYSGGVITLQPASASFPGGVTTGTQTFAGSKTFAQLTTNAQLTVTSGGAAITGTISGTSNIQTAANTGSTVNVGATNQGAGAATLSVERTGTGSTATTNYRTSGSPQWLTGLAATGNNNFVIQNATGAVNALSFDKSTNELTLSSLTNGLVKSTSGVLSNATANTDYLPVANPTFTGTMTGGAFAGTSATFSGWITSTLGNNQRIFTSASATTGYQYFDILNTSGRMVFALEGSTAGTVGTGSLAYASTLFSTGSTALQLGTDGTIRATIDASGNVGIGTTSPNQQLHINGASTSSAIQLTNTATGTGSSDGLRILQSGLNATLTNFEAGSIAFETSNTTALTIASNQVSTFTSATGGIEIFNVNNSNASTPFGQAIRFTAASPNNATQYFLEARDATTARFTFYSNGGIANYSANNVNLSDARSKRKITEMGSYWDKFKNFQFVNYQYKDEKASEARMKMGVTAQQIELYAPELVNNSGSFGKAPDGSNLKSVYEQQLMYVSFDVLKEALIRIEALEAKVNQTIK